MIKTSYPIYSVCAVDKNDLTFGRQFDHRDMAEAYMDALRNAAHVRTATLYYWRSKVDVSEMQQFINDPPCPKRAYPWACHPLADPSKEIKSAYSWKKAGVA